MVGIVEVLKWRQFSAVSRFYLQEISQTSSLSICTSTRICKHSTAHTHTHTHHKHASLLGKRGATQHHTTPYNKPHHNTQTQIPHTHTHTQTRTHRSRGDATPHHTSQDITPHCLSTSFNLPIICFSFLVLVLFTSTGTSGMSSLSCEKRVLGTGKQIWITGIINENK